MAYAAFLFIVLIWSYSWIVVKLALQFIGPFDFAFFRTFIGLIALFLIGILSKKIKIPKHIGLVALLGIFQTGIFLILACWALVAGGAGKTSILVYTMPFWVVLLSKFLLKEKVIFIQWTATFIALCGLILILEPWSMGGNFFSKFLAVLCGMSWAVSVVVAKIIHNKEDTDILSLTAWQMFFGIIPMVIVSFIVKERPIDYSDYLVFALLYSGLFATAIAWALWLYLLKKLPPHIVGLNVLLIPALAILISWIQLGEVPNLSEFFGILLILSALLLTYLSSLIAFRKQKLDF